MMDIDAIIEKNPEIYEKIRDIKLRKAAKELEAIFIAQVIKAMEKSLPGGGIGGKKNNLVNMLFSSTMGKAIAERGGVGLSDMIYRSLKSKEGKGVIGELPGEDYLRCLEFIKGTVVLGDADE